MKALLTIILSFVLSFGHAQTCTIQTESSNSFEKSFEEEIHTFLSLEFSINGVSFKTSEGRKKTIPVNRNGFDTLRYSYIWKDQKFEEYSLCKFRPNEQYTISPCTCCGIFLLTPKRKAERGFVKFINHSANLYLGSVSELDYDSIPANSHTEFIFSAISMNCGFRPSQIAVFAPEYANPEYQYKNLSRLSEPEKQALKAQQQKLVKYDIPFLFIHGEKLILTIEEGASQFKLELE
ncbi:hypothetical protein D3C71_892340 [compost metagenome]